MHYYSAKYYEYCETTLYRTYVTDSLQGIVQSKYVGKRWLDIRNGDQNEKYADDASGDDIALDIITRAGLKLAVGGESA